MLQECIEHESANVRGSVDTDDERSEDVGEQIRFRHELWIVPVRLQQGVDEIRLLAVALLRPVSCQYFVGKRREPPFRAPEAGQALAESRPITSDMNGQERIQIHGEVIKMVCCRNAGGNQPELLDDDTFHRAPNTQGATPGPVQDNAPGRVMDHIEAGLQRLGRKASRQQFAHAQMLRAIHAGDETLRPGRGTEIGIGFRGFEGAWRRFSSRTHWLRGPQAR